jgi:cold shock CspA family protein
MMATQLDRIERMLQILCDHLGVHDTKAPRTEVVKDLPSENGGRHVGIVSRFEHGWGFIESAELGRNFFVHYSDVDGTGLRVLEAGEEVSFEVGPGKDGRPKAVRVRRPSKGEGVPSQPPVNAAPAQGTTREDTGIPGAVEDAGDEEEEMPQPASSEVLPRRSPARRTTTKRVRLGAVPGRRPAISW